MNISNIRPIVREEFDYRTLEFTASGVRRIIQDMFPTRKLVLSQFTLYHQIGLSKPSGDNFKRGRRCYRLYDLLPIALVLVLKEQGIPNKNIGNLPKLISGHAEQIFNQGRGVRVSGYKEVCNLSLLDESHGLGEDIALLAMLAEDPISSGVQDLYWSYDIGYLASELIRVASRINAEDKELMEMENNRFQTRLAVA